MRIKPSIGLIVGPVNETHWGQVLTMPNAYGVVEISDSSDTAQEKGVAILTELSRLLSSDITSLRGLEELCDTVYTQIVQTLILLVPVGNVIYLVIRGVGSVYVKRASELASLMHKDGAVSGEVKCGDTLLLASSGFSNVLTREELTGLFDHLPPPEIAEKLTLILHEKTGGEGSAALVFGVSEFIDTNPATPTIPQEAPPVRHEVIEKHSPTKAALSQKIKIISAEFFKKPKIVTAALVIFFILFFIVSVVLGIKKQASVKQNQKISVILADAGHALEEGVALMDLNPAKGRERLEEARTLLAPLQETVSTRTTEGRNVLELYRKVTDNLTLALHVTNVAPALFYDVSLLKKNSKIGFLAREADSIVLSDSSTNTIYKMNIASKNTQIIGGGEQIKEGTFVASHGSKTYVYTQTGVMEISDTGKKPVLVIPKDPEWGTISSLVSFGGNIYMLDTIKSRIWKYVATEKGFSERREYLNPDTLPDLTRATDMSIDGSVWLGSATGKILRFAQGKENVFIPKGVDSPFGVSLTAYTSDDTKLVYISDSQNNRIVVLDKEGMYVSQYQLEGEMPKAFVVFEEQKKILLLIAGKLYTLDLK